MTHEDARALLGPYAVGALDLETAAEVRHHIGDGCDDCFRELFARRTTAVVPRPDAAVVPRPEAPRVPEVVIEPAARAAALAARVAMHVAERRRRAMVATALAVVASLAIVVTVGVVGQRILAPSASLARRVAALENERAELVHRVAELTDALLASNDAPPPAAPSIAADDAVGPSTPGDAGPVDTVARDDTDASDGARHESPMADAAPPAQESSELWIRYTQDMLSVRIRNAALPDVLRELGAQSGLAVHAGVVDTRTVNVTFDGVPFEQGLRRLLGAQNFLLTYDGSRPQTLEILETPQVAAAADAEPPAASPAQSIATMLDPRPPVVLSDTLVAALGTRAMSLRQLLDIGINHADQAVRSSAIRAAVDALQADPGLRAAMFGARPGLSGGIFGALVEDMDPARAEEMLFYVSLQARDSQLRIDAASLIRRVAAAAPGREG